MSAETQEALRTERYHFSTFSTWSEVYVSAVCHSHLIRVWPGDSFDLKTMQIDSEQKQGRFFLVFLAATSKKYSHTFSTQINNYIWMFGF